MPGFVYASASKMMSNYGMMSNERLLHTISIQLSHLKY